MMAAASTGLKMIIPFEPHIWLGSEQHPLIIQVNTNAGRNGDVRDVLFLKHTNSEGQEWEIGTSCKWNHNALKHSRLSKEIDFGYEWLGYNCSQQYWDGIHPIMEELESLRGSMWRNLNFKPTRFYRPLLVAFIKELLLIAENHLDVPRKLAEYFIGRYDFYKIIGIKKSRRTYVQPFNLHKTLNHRDGGIKPLNIIESQRGGMPTSLVDIRFVNNTDNTITIILDQGWQFNLRIHNADTLITPSLKFDINFSGNPIAYFTNNW